MLCTTGGNQREKDRERAAKKAAANAKKPKESANTLAARKEAYVSLSPARKILASIELIYDLNLEMQRR